MMDDFQLNFDLQQAQVLLRLLRNECLMPAEWREIISLEQSLENQLHEE